MEDNKEKDYWIIWYPSYTHKDFELKDKDNSQPIIEDLTDNYFSNIHTYLKIETSPSRVKEDIRLSFYKIERIKTFFYSIKQLYHNHLFHKKSLHNKQYKEDIKYINIPQNTQKANTPSP